MRDIAFAFLLAAVVFVTGGMTLGIWMGITGNFQFAPVHAHLNLVGWVTLALFGLYYRLTPQAAQGLLPRIHATLAILGVALMTGGIAYAMTGGSEGPAIAGSLVTFASMLVFLFTVIRHGFGAASSRQARMSPDAAMMAPAE